VGRTGRRRHWRDEVTSRIGNTLNLELIAAEAARPADHPDALDYILRGRAAYAKGPAREHKDEAIGFLERALAIDPQSVEAQTWLAGILAASVREGQSDSPVAEIERAEGLVTQALALAPRSARVHTAKGGLLRAKCSWDEAISEYETALASDRNSAISLFGIGICKVHTGLVEEAIQPLDQSIRLDARGPYIVYRYNWLGKAHLLQSRIDEAITWFEKARSISPGVPQARANLASAYGLKGETERIVSKLNGLRVARTIGSLPENINFAVRAHLARALLDKNGIKYDTASPKPELLETPEIAEKTFKFTAMVQCYK
jgi:tetratricopeptide (TPR) repeat protein